MPRLGAIERMIIGHDGGQRDHGWFVEDVVVQVYTSIYTHLHTHVHTHVYTHAYTHDFTHTASDKG